MVAAAGEVTMLLASDGRLYTCGDGSDGQLGHGTASTFPSPTEVSETEEGTLIQSLGITKVATADRFVLQPCKRQRSANSASI